MEVIQVFSLVLSHLLIFLLLVYDIDADPSTNKSNISIR